MRLLISTQGRWLQATTRLLLSPVHCSLPVLMLVSSGLGGVEHVHWVTSAFIEASAG